MKRPFRRRRLARWLRDDIGRTALLGLGDDDCKELLFEANRLVARGKLDDAKRLFLLAAGFFGEAAEPWIGLGACAQLGGDIPTAMDRYETALRKRPGDPHALANLAECALLIGDNHAARSALSQLTPETRSKLDAGLAGRIRELEALADGPPRDPSPSPGGEVATSEVVYADEKEMSEVEFRSLLERSTLAERRPMDEPGAIRLMLLHAGPLVTARVGGKLVGISRALTDFAFCTYLSDLAVDRDYQRRGIGRELIRRTHEAAGLHTTLILLAAPLARSYYPHIGMTPHDSCWIIPRTPPSISPEDAT